MTSLRSKTRSSLRKLPLKARKDLPTRVCNVLGNRFSSAFGKNFPGHKACTPGGADDRKCIFRFIERADTSLFFPGGGSLANDFEALFPGEHGIYFLGNIDRLNKTYIDRFLYSIACDRLRTFFQRRMSVSSWLKMASRSSKKD
jgi:hypothetical protein